MNPDPKPRIKNGDPVWRPAYEKDGNVDVLSPSEAKQMWLEREVMSLRHALDRVAVPKPLQQSGYWNVGSGSSDKPQSLQCAVVWVPLTLVSRVTTTGCMVEVVMYVHASHGGSGAVCPADRASHGGSGAVYPPDRASHDLRPLDRALHGGSGHVCPHDRAFQVPDAVRAAYLHGDHLGKDRAFQNGGDDQQGRAPFEHGEHQEGARAFWCAWCGSWTRSGFALRWRTKAWAS